MAITNVPEYPNASLRVQVAVSQGIKQLQRSLGMGVGLYQSTDAAIKQETTEIGPGSIFRSNANDNIETLVVVTNLPLVLNGKDLSDNFVALEVNRLLVIDSPLKSFTLTNAGDAKARVQMYMISKQREVVADGFWYGVAIPPATYNDAFVKSLTPLQGEKNRTFTVNAGQNQNIYYCYPASLGLSAFTVNGFTGGFALKPTVQVNTENGPVPYYVYESDYPGLGSTTVTVSDAI